MPCEAENPNVPVSLGLAYNPETHTCDWPDLLTGLGCDPAERLDGFKVTLKTFAGQDICVCLYLFYQVTTIPPLTCPLSSVPSCET